MTKINVTLDHTNKYEISNQLFGIFLEDIGFGADGGLNANMVNNYSFEGVYFDNATRQRVVDELRYWESDCKAMEVGNEQPLSSNSKYAHVTIEGRGTLCNRGYNGLQSHRDECAMSIKKDAQYDFSCKFRPTTFQGNITVQIVSNHGTALTNSATVTVTGDEKSATSDGTTIADETVSSGTAGSNETTHPWQDMFMRVTGVEDGYGMLQITLEGDGELDLDCVIFRSEDVWNKDDPKWAHGKLRKDMVEALRDLHPAFLRFPGGCIVEGMRKSNEYQWKNTVGALWERKSDYNLWSEKISDGGYNQSYQIGFYEYFCLCEDLGMKPLPTLSAGLNCQIRQKQYKFKEKPQAISSDYFQNEIIANHLDLIEFANGDPKTGRWAKLRADMGHPAPFHLEMIGIGNENFGRGYRKRFTVINNAIKERYPDMECVMCAGFLPQKPFLWSTYNYVNRKHPGTIVDEHSYSSPQWFENEHTRYDNYKRGKAKVYVGEYSANGMMAGKTMTADNSNCLDSALGEAAFMAGLERNGDVVKMASFAPLFNMVDCEQWFSNLIDFSPSGVCPSVNYYVQQMFMTRTGTMEIPCHAQLPEHVYVTASEDEEQLYLKVVNTGEEAFQLYVPVPGMEGKEIITETISGALNDKNSISFYGEREMKCHPDKQQGTIEGTELIVPAPKQSLVVVQIHK